MMIKRQLLAAAAFSSLSFSLYADTQWTLFEDLLYWHASQQSTSIWAYQFSLDSNLNQGTYFTEPNTSFGWSPGLRLGIEYQHNDAPDLTLYWTHFDTKTTDSISAPPGLLLLPQFFNGFTTSSVYNSAQLNWNIEMNMVDAKVGQRYHPTSSLTLHPAIGLKGGTINQGIESAWDMTLFNIPLYHANENLKNNFAGIGPSVSLDGVWQLTEGFSLRSDVETAILWGRWNIQDNFYRPNSLFYTEKTIQSTTKDTLGAFMASYFLGVEWTIQTKALITLRAGYEMQFWSNQLRLPIFQALPIHGDLTLQGGTCGISIKL